MDCANRADRGRLLQRLASYVSGLEGVDGAAEDDPEVEKMVMALTSNDALDKARELVKAENSELDYMKIRFWHIERRYDRFPLVR